MAHVAVPAAVATVMTGVIASGATGYIRDASIASVLGATRQADAFFIGYTWIDLLVAGLVAILAAGLIPSLASHTSDTTRKALATSFLVALALIGVGLCLMIFIVAPWAVSALAPGADDAEAASAVAAMRIMAPGVAAIVVTSGAAAILGYWMRFLAPALAASTYNLTLAGGALITGHSGIDALALTATAGATLQAGILLIVLDRRRLISLRTLGWSLGRGFAVLRPAIPILIGTFLSYSAIIVDRATATKVSLGGVAELNYAIRVSSTFNQAIGSAVAIAAFPVIARAVAENSLTGAGEAIRRAMRLVVLISLPVLAIAIPWRNEIVSVLYQHGSFESARVSETGGLVAILVLGYAADGIAQPIWRLWFSLKWTWPYVLVNLGQLTVHLTILVLAAKLFGLLGIAVAFSGALTMQAIVLWVSARRMLGPIMYAEDVHLLLGGLACSIPTAGVAAFLVAVTSSADGGVKILAFLGSLILGALSWGTLLVARRVPELKAVEAMYSRGQRRVSAAVARWRFGHPGSALSVIAAGLAAFVGVVPEMAGNEWLLAPLVLLLIITVIVLLDAGLRRWRIDLLSPYVGFPLVYTLFFGLGSINFLPPASVASRDVIILMPVSSAAPLAAGAGLVAYFAAVTAARRLAAAQHDRGFVRADTRSYPAARCYGVAFVALGVGLAAALYALRTGAPLLSGATDTSRVQVGAENGPAFTIYSTAMIVAGVFVSLATFAPGSFSRRWRITAWVCVMVTSLMTTLLFGDRAFFAEVALIVFPVAYYCRERPLRLLTLVIAAVIAISAIGAFGVWREEQTGRSVATEYTQYGFPDWSLSVAPAYSYWRATVVAYDQTIQLVPKYHDYNYGRQFMGGAIGLLPGRHDEANAFFKNLLGLNFVNGLGVPASLLGVFYADAGLLGVLLGMALLGAVMQGLYGWYRSRRQPGALTAYAFVVKLALWGLFAGPFPFITYLSVPAVLAIGLSYARVDERSQMRHRGPIWAWGAAMFVVAGLVVYGLKATSPA